jgi:hypothetical protein
LQVRYDETEELWMMEELWMSILASTRVCGGVILQLRGSILASMTRMRRRRRAGVARGPQREEGELKEQGLFKAKAVNEVDAERGRATQA